MAGRAVKGVTATDLWPVLRDIFEEENSLETEKDIKENTEIAKKVDDSINVDEAGNQPNVSTILVKRVKFIPVPKL